MIASREVMPVGRRISPLRLSISSLSAVAIGFIIEILSSRRSASWAGLAAPHCFFVGGGVSEVGAMIIICRVDSMIPNAVMKNYDNDAPAADRTAAQFWPLAGRKYHFESI